MILNPLLIERIKKINKLINIRIGDFKDVDNFVSVFNNHYKKQTNIEYFRWQFIDTPYPTNLFIAFDGDKPIGFCGVKIFDLNNKLEKIGYIVDLLIANNYRKRGVEILLFEKIFDYVNTYSVCCLISLPNQYGNKSLSSIGFKTIAKIDSLVLNIENYVPNIEEDIISKDYDNCFYLDIKKDFNYFNWRYPQHPNYNYDKILLDENSFAFVKIYKDINNGTAYLDIMDIVFSDLVSLRNLFDIIICFSKNNNILNLSVWAIPNSYLHRFLIFKGFKQESRERYFSVYKVKELDIEIDDINSWNLSQSYSETY
jgi:hypothetical protein